MVYINIMPTMKKLEEALRGLGWSPLASDTSSITRAWVNPLSTDTIRVERTHFVTRSNYRRIVRRAKLNPYR